LKRALAYAIVSLLVDVLADLLTRAHARGALFAETALAAPWGLAFGATTPLAFHTVLRGEAWLRRADAETGEDWLRLRAGDLVLVRAPSAHAMAGAPGTPCLPLDEVVETWRVGDRRFRAPHAATAETVVLRGAYGFEGSLCDTLIAALPPIVHLPAPQAPPLRAALELVAGEVAGAAPGAQTVLDRLLDTVLVFALRQHFATTDAPALVRALGDPQVGAVLKLMHADPARAWTVASLAREVGLARAALARRFTALVGRPPLGHLTDLRMGLAEERLRAGDVKLAQVAAEVGYASEFAFSAAFKRERGVAPAVWRRAARAAA